MNVLNYIPNNEFAMHQNNFYTQQQQQPAPIQDYYGTMRTQIYDPRTMQMPPRYEDYNNYGEAYDQYNQYYGGYSTYNGADYHNQKYATLAHANYQPIDPTLEHILKENKEAWDAYNSGKYNVETELVDGIQKIILREKGKIKGKKRGTETKEDYKVKVIGTVSSNGDEDGAVNGDAATEDDEQVKTKNASSLNGLDENHEDENGVEANGIKSSKSDVALERIVEVSERRSQSTRRQDYYAYDANGYGQYPYEYPPQANYLSQYMDPNAYYPPLVDPNMYYHQPGAMMPQQITTHTYRHHSRKHKKKEKEHAAVVSTNEEGDAKREENGETNGTENEAQVHKKKSMRETRAKDRKPNRNGYAYYMQQQMAQQQQQQQLGYPAQNQLIPYYEPQQYPAAFGPFANPAYGAYYPPAGFYQADVKYSYKKHRHRRQNYSLTKKAPLANGHATETGDESAPKTQELKVPSDTKVSQKSNSDGPAEFKANGIATETDEEKVNGNAGEIHGTNGVETPVDSLNEKEPEEVVNVNEAVNGNSKQEEEVKVESPKPKEIKYEKLSLKKVEDVFRHEEAKYGIHGRLPTAKLHKVFRKLKLKIPVEEFYPVAISVGVTEIISLRRLVEVLVLLGKIDPSATRSSRAIFHSPEDAEVNTIMQVRPPPESYAVWA